MLQLNFVGAFTGRLYLLLSLYPQGIKTTLDSFCDTQESAFYHKMSVDHNASASAVSAQNFAYQSYDCDKE